MLRTESSCSIAINALAVAREFRFDVLRVIGAFSVVWLHVSAVVVRNDPDLRSMTWWVGNVADALSRWCVPVFVMLSGAMLLDGKIRQLQEFYTRCFMRLLPLFFSGRPCSCQKVAHWQRVGFYYHASVAFLCICGIYVCWWEFICAFRFCSPCFLLPPGSSSSLSV